MAFNFQGIISNLPTLWSKAAEVKESVCNSVLLKLPDDPYIAAGELRQKDAGVLSKILSKLRENAKLVPSDSSIEQQARAWLAYALELSRVADVVLWDSEWVLSGTAVTLKTSSEELTLVLLLIAGLWRQSGRYFASNILLLDAEQQKELAKKSINAFKQAASVYQYVIQQNLAHETAGQIDKHPLLHKATARALALLAQAEYQAMWAHMALLGNKINIVSALHVGAADLFTETVQELRATLWENEAELLVSYAKLSASVQYSRANLSTAFKLEDEDPACAWAHALEASRLFDEARPLAGQHQEWEEAVAAEKTAVDTAALHFKSRTEQVALRGTPTERGPLPAGKIQPVPEFDLAGS